MFLKFYAFNVQDDDEMIEKPYNPKTGFIMKNLTVKDSGWYKCLIKKDNKTQEIYYILSVNRKYDRHKILIESYMQTSKSAQ